VTVPGRKDEPVSEITVTVRTDGFVKPCIPTLAGKPPSGPDWVHEIKHDGYRLIVRRGSPVHAARLFVGGLKSLQDALGDLNDIRFTRDLAHGSKASVSSRAFAAGRVSGREEARRAVVLKSAQDAFDRFRREERYRN